MIKGWDLGGGEDFAGIYWLSRFVHEGEMGSPIESQIDLSSNFILSQGAERVCWRAGGQ
jgi:hypothetical protein